ncbi:N-acetyl-gamma-glutamyl-phosphate reductase [Streptomyces cinnamoneus]|uniref:N-acetyl-gamma-glutamyl-phosphate reductase n=1 Tax=Streptomyces cinnamoneus TaxID=53446 RepID=UPI003B96950B
MAIHAAVAGASGYAGGEVLRLLLAHPEVRIGALTGNSNAGQRLAALQPHLPPLADRVLEATTTEALAGHDVVFLALPHGQSARGRRAARGRRPGHRLRRGLPPARRGGLGALLRLAARRDLALRAARAARRTPGAARRQTRRGARVLPDRRLPRALPRLRAGLAEPEAVIVAASGTSGAGKAAKPHLLGSEVMGSMSPYGVGGGHRHTPEMVQNLSAVAGEPVTVSFTPTLAPMPRGILATCSTKARPGVTAQAVRAAYEKAFQDEPFARLLPEGQWPATASVYGSNTALVQVALDEAAGRIVAVAAIDNLTKGTAGGAVQSMNLALGLPEELGLPATGVAP